MQTKIILNHSIYAAASQFLLFLRSFLPLFLSFYDTQDWTKAKRKREMSIKQAFFLLSCCWYCSLFSSPVSFSDFFFFHSLILHF